MPGSAAADLDLTMMALVCTLAYLLGAVPFGLLLVRLFRHQDVRSQGSGNIGATNVARVAGRSLGVVTLVMDACKGAAAVVAARALGLGEAGMAAAGAAAFLGHCYPVYLRFHGGKGIATGFGVLVAIRPLEAMVAVAAFAVTFAITRVSSLSSLVGMVTVAVVAVIIGVETPLLILLAAMLGVAILKHLPNIRRLAAGKELRF